MVARWPAVAGAAIARNAWPARIARDGTLHVSTADSVWAFELAHAAAELARRLGVPAVRFGPGPLPSHDDLPERPRLPRPTREQEARAAEIAAPIAHEEVRRTVQRAALSGLLRGAVDPSL